MAPIPGGRFTMGSDDFYAEERPARTVDVAAFWIDLQPVSNRAFAAFVDATAYVTAAECGSTAGDCGSFVFRMTDGPVDVRGAPVWWHFIDGASWRRPDGAASSLADRWELPVVHVSHADARAYAAWCGKRLPSEREWERAARGGLEGAPYAWGATFLIDGQRMANTWQGAFPWHNSAPRSPGPSAPGAYPPNAYGLYDMIGNVWEWTSEPAPSASHAHACCAGTAAGAESAIVKGGSYLCADEYCRRYRPAARIAQPLASTSAHIGFRCARDR